MDRFAENKIMKPVMTVKDRALDIYNLPFTQTTVAQGVRSFTDEINSNPETSGLAKHPDDYDLYVIGHYDDTTGRLWPLEVPELVVRGKDLVRPADSILHGRRS